MTLLELLVKELHKYGGWPESMACACKSRVDGEIYFYKKLHHDSRITKGLCDFSIYLSERDESESNHDGYIYVSRAQYQSALAASQKVKWLDGLPPVGVECEYQWAGDAWKKGVIAYISTKTVLIIEQFDGEESESAFGICDTKFRPLRTEADKKRDAAVKRITLSGWHIDAAMSIYDLIAAGKIPGVKLDD